MEIVELEPRLLSFSRAMYEDPAAEVSEVFNMPGHAGFSYGFTVTSGETIERWYLRLPPPNVRWAGTADVLRQVEVLSVLEATSVPHCSVRWSGDDLQWFGCPYFIVPQLEGAVVGFADDAWIHRLQPQKRVEMARQAMKALAGIHRLDWHSAPYLGTPIPFEDDVVRWDRFVEKAAEPQRLEQVPAVRKLLLERIPRDPRIGIFHGDFQWSNLFYSPAGELLAVIDWELVGVGATLNDVGWIATFNDPMAWTAERAPSGMMPQVEELLELYQETWGMRVEGLAWFRALAAYKFAIISGFNLALHRRGKRIDPDWETTALSIEPLLGRALDLLT